MFDPGISAAQCLAGVQAKLRALRDDLYEIQKLQSWASGLSAADLQGPPWNFPASQATGILSAIADANGLALLYNTGTDPRNPGPNYVYGASQRSVIGPA